MKWLKGFLMTCLLVAAAMLGSAVEAEEAYKSAKQSAYESITLEEVRLALSKTPVLEKSDDSFDDLENSPSRHIPATYYRFNKTLRRLKKACTNKSKSVFNCNQTIAPKILVAPCNIYCKQDIGVPNARNIFRESEHICKKPNQMRSYGFSVQHTLAIS